jgi:hypothetical protein
MGELIDHPSKREHELRRLIAEWCSERRKLGQIFDPHRCFNGGIMPPDVEAAYREIYGGSPRQPR